jgi:hypothetical protein
MFTLNPDPHRPGLGNSPRTKCGETLLADLVDGLLDRCISSSEFLWRTELETELAEMAAKDTDLRSWCIIHKLFFLCNLRIGLNATLFVSMM